MRGIEMFHWILCTTIVLFVDYLIKKFKLIHKFILIQNTQLYTKKDVTEGRINFVKVKVLILGDIQSNKVSRFARREKLTFWRIAST